MASPPHDRKYYTIGICAMLLVVLLLGVRSMRTVNSVLAAKVPTVEQNVEHPRLVKAELKGVTARDSLVANALLEKGLRDPFLRARGKPSARRPVEAPQAVVRPIDPLLTALIFDNVNPTVQITVGSDRSDWLRAGDQFRGWQVAEIDAKSVKVKKGDREIVLH